MWAAEFLTTVAKFRKQIGKVLSLNYKMLIHNNVGILRVAINLEGRKILENYFLGRRRKSLRTPKVIDCKATKFNLFKNANIKFKP